MNRSVTWGLTRGLVGILHTVLLHKVFSRRIPKFGCVFLFLAMSVSANDGGLDLTFGSGGKVITDFTGRSDIGQAVAIQSDGKIVVVGQSGDANNVFHSALARYNPDGTLDTTFGIGGRALITLDAGGDLLDSVVIQPDGKIVAAGALNQNNSNLAVLIARFNSDGSLDTGFGNGGKYVTTFGDPAAQANALVLQPDGKIVVAGTSGFGSYSELNDMVLVRLKTDGNPDSTFGNGGKLRTHFDGETNTGTRGMDVMLMPDGRIVEIGSYKTEVIQRQFAAARFMPNGDLDPTFDHDGKVTTLLGSFHSFGMTGVLQSDGKLVIGGFKDARRNNDFALARYNLDGSLDSTFGSGGIVINDLFGSSDDVVYSLNVLRDGRLVATGMTGDYPNFRFGLARYNTNGTFDPSFGTAGKVLTDFGGVSNRSFGAAVQANGKIVLAGYTVAATGDFTNNFAVARYNVTTHATPFDFDGDSRTDVGIFRPSVGEWWISRSGDGQVRAYQFGASTDNIAPADFTGDGKSDVAIFRPSTGEWFVLRSEDNSYFSFPFGTSGDIVMPADYDADGRADPAVFRPSSGMWFINRSSDGVTTSTPFGTNGDLPVAADYDSDGRADIGIYRPSAGEWWLNRSTAGVIAMAFGNSSDRPVPGDYTGDGKVDAAFWRPGTGEWFILRSEDMSYYSGLFGAAGDIPAPGDLDGDGRFDLTVFRPSNGTWFAQRSTAGAFTQQFGANGDRPLSSAFVP